MRGLIRLMALLGDATVAALSFGARASLMMVAAASLTICGPRNHREQSVFSNKTPGASLTRYPVCVLIMRIST